MSTDARVRYTKNVIRETFLALLEEKPLARITVTEICKRAEINRATFYKHYEDVYDLMEKTEEEMLEGYRKSLEDIESMGTRRALTDALVKMKKYAYTYFPVFTSHGDPEFAGKLAKMGSDRFAGRIDIPIREGEPEEKRKLCYLYISSGCIGIIGQWMKEGLKEEPEEVAAILMEFVTATVAGMRDRSRTK